MPDVKCNCEHHVHPFLSNRAIGYGPVWYPVPEEERMSTDKSREKATILGSLGLRIVLSLWSPCQSDRDEEAKSCVKHASSI